MPPPVILTCEASVVIFAAQYGAFFWASVGGRLRYPETFDEKLSPVKPIHIALMHRVSTR